MIAFTGPTGSLGSQMPPEAVPLHTRLERPLEDMERELRALGAEDLALVHLAAMASVEECERDPERARKWNVEGSLKWLEAAGRNRCRHFVFVSTAHVFAAPPDRLRLDVDSPTEPRSVYARTKLEAEQALHEQGARYPGMRLTVARVFGVLSPAMRPGFLWTRLHEQAARGDDRPIPGLSGVRDYLDAREVCRELVRLAEAIAPPPLVLVCSGRETTVRELAERVFREHGLDPARLREAPPRPDEVPYLVGVPTPF